MSRAAWGAIALLTATPATSLAGPGVDAVRVQGVMALGGGAGGAAGAEGPLAGPFRWSADLGYVAQPPLRWNGFARAGLLTRWRPLGGLVVEASLAAGLRQVGVLGPTYEVRGDRVERTTFGGRSMWCASLGAGVGWEFSGRDVPLTIMVGVEPVLSGPWFEGVAVDLHVPVRATWRF